MFSTNPLGRTQMSVEFPTPSGVPSRLSCCEAQGLRFPLWCFPANLHRVKCWLVDFLQKSSCFQGLHCSLVFLICDEMLRSLLTPCYLKFTHLVCWPKVVWRTHRRKYDEKSSSPFAFVVVSFHHTLSFSLLVSPPVPNPQRLPHSLALSGTVPGTKHRASEPKETVGRAVKRGLPL